jgi:putative membrane protein
MNKQNWIRKQFSVFIKGMAMGVVEFLPGISGGTIAFVTGIYEELLNTIKGAFPALKQLFGKKSFKQRMIDFWKTVNGNFIMALILGIGTAILLTARIVKLSVENYPIIFGAFVFGLVAASIALVYKKVSKWTLACYLLGIVGVGLALLLPNTSVVNQQIVSEAYFFLCAVLAACAFILPGTSGTFVMVLMGAYWTLTTAMTDGNLTYIAIFIVGVLIGLILFSNFVSWLLKKWHDWTVALLTGFIAGSLKIIWPWKTEVGGNIENTLPDAMIVEAIIACIVGIILVLGIELLAKKLTAEKK